MEELLEQMSLPSCVRDSRAVPLQPPRHFQRWLLLEQLLRSQPWETLSSVSWEIIASDPCERPRDWVQAAATSAGGAALSPACHSSFVPPSLSQHPQPSSQLLPGL